MSAKIKTSIATNHTPKLEEICQGNGGHIQTTTCNDV